MEATHQALLGCLEAQRAHVLGILDDLSDEDLRRPLLPSGWSCLSVIRHLALDVEQFWFRMVMSGELPIPTDDSSAWDVPAGEDVIGCYRAEVAAANAVITSMSVEDPPLAWPDFFGTFRLPDLRAVLLHVIAETACHAGHLDAARELIDRRQWLVLT